MEEIEDEDEEVLQLKIKTNQTPVATSNLNSRIQSLKGKGQPLSTSQRRFFEPRFGCDFREVRIHTDSKAAEIANLVNAKAFTVGSDVAFNTNEYSPKSQSCQRLLAHELTHVIQQGKSSQTPDINTPLFLNNSIMGPVTAPGSSSLETENANATIQRKITVENPKAKIPKPGGKGLDQTNATTVQNYLAKLCSTGLATVKSSGSIDISKALCTPMIVTHAFGAFPLPSPAALSKTPTGCGCLCDMVHSKHPWKIKVDDTRWPLTVFDDSAAANGKKPGGTGGIVTTPSPNSPKLWGAATAAGKTVDIDPWLVLGHELCGHGWLGNFGIHGSDIAKPRGEGGHQETIKRENKLRAEHGIDLRGTFKDPFCGESYWRDKKKPGKVNWSGFLSVCKNWRKAYNKSNKTKYKISDRIP